MNRITELFQKVKRENRKVLIPFITAGYPDLESTPKLLSALFEGGADLIEIGIPFSDPIADGPIIQASSQIALQNGVTVKWIFKTIKSLRKTIPVPLIFFTYLNPILRYGLEKFFKDAESIGVDGVLIPDLPPEESKEIKNIANANNVKTIFLISPTSSNERMRLIEKLSDDFIYCVSVTGTTGTRDKLYSDIKPYLMRLKSNLKKPYVVGFGISTVEDVSKISEFSNGVVVGSALIKFIEKLKNDKNFYEKVRNYIRKLKRPLI